MHVHAYTMDVTCMYHAFTMHVYLLELLDDAAHRLHVLAAYWWQEAGVGQGSGFVKGSSVHTERGGESRGRDEGRGRNEGLRTDEGRGDPRV